MLSLRRISMVAVALGFVATLTLFSTAQVRGQKVRMALQKGGGLVPPQPTQPTSPTLNTGQFTDGITHEKVDQLKNYITAAQDWMKGKEPNWDKAIKALQDILDHPKDMAVEVTDHNAKTNQDSTRWVNAKKEANRLIGRMPADGLNRYEGTAGGRARNLLEDAKKRTDLRTVAQVAWRYMHTKAGAEANEMLATHLLDRGDYHGAAIKFQRLLAMAKGRSVPIDIANLTLFKAALAFRRAGDKQSADKAWNALQSKLPQSGLEIAGRSVPVERLEQALNKVVVQATVSQRDWGLVGGNVARDAQADGSTPLLDEVIKISTVDDTFEEEKDAQKNPDTDTWLKMAFEAQQRFNQPVLSGFQPVAADNKVIFRTYKGLVAVYVKDGVDQSGERYKAGELAWKSDFKASLTAILKEPNYRQTLNTWQTYYRTSLTNILYENSAAGTLSTIGGKVYAVDDMALPPHPFWMTQFGGWNPQQPPYPGDMKTLVLQNTLMAFDLTSGKLEWELPDRHNPGDFADSHFLGAPIPIGGKLYVLNEKKNELRLLVLEPRVADPSKGLWEVKVLRSQVLCGVKDAVTRDIKRRASAVHLAYGEGILVVPTNAGAVLGVDLLTQSLIWSYSYREGQANQPASPPNMGWPPRQPITDSNAEFKNAPPVIAGGKVVFAAPDGGSIHCVDLHDGIGLWHVKRSDDLYLAGVWGGKVVLVGKSRTRALQLESGRVAWDVETGTPSGRGVASKGIYYLPVRNRDKQGEICTIDLARGAVKAHNRMRKADAPPPGNLIFHEGRLLSQTPTQVAAYLQMDVRIKEIAQELKGKPGNPYWLTERGELYLADGKVKHAVEDLRNAKGTIERLLKDSTAKADEVKEARETLPKTKLKLFEAFTELFQNEFKDAAELYLKEYEAMCKADTPAETNRRMARFLFQVGRGREGQGRLVEAYDAYVRFAGLPLNKDKINDLEDSYHKARPDVWVRGRVAAMLAGATPKQRAPLEAKIAKEWQAIQSKNDLDAIRRFVSTFDVAFAVGRQARLALADAVMEKNDKSAFLEAELTLLQLRAASLADDPVTRARALEGLARLEIKKGSTDAMRLAARYYRQLGEEFPDTVVREEQTGSDYFDNLATDKRFLPYLGEDDEPRILGPMKAKAGTPAQLGIQANFNYNLQNAFTFMPRGPALPFFQKHRLVFSTNSRQLIWLERGSKKEVWSHNPNNLTNYQYYSYLNNYSQTHLFPNASFRFYQVKGHLAALQIGPMVYGLDLVNKKTLWEKNLLEQAPQINTNYQINPNQWDGTLEMMTWDRFGGQPYTRKLGMLGNLEAGYVSIQTQNGLVVLDPIKGTELWTKSDLPARTQVFGDDRHIFLIEVRDGKAVGGARCLRASDGVQLKEVPDFAKEYDKRLLIRGGKLLVADTFKDSKVLRLYDVAKGKDVWKRTFHAKATALRSENADLAGMVEPDGKVTVVNVKTNKEVLQGKVDPDHLKDVNDALLLDDDDHFYVSLNKPLGAAVANAYLYSNFANGTRCTMVNGKFYAFHRKNGHFHWHVDVPHQMVVLEQFKNNPVIIFTARFYQNQVNWIMMAGTKTVDKKTGKRLHDPEPKNSNGFQYFALDIDVKNGHVDLVGSFDAVRHFVDTTRKAKKKVPADSPKEQKRSGKVEGEEQPPKDKRPVRGGGRRLPPPPPPPIRNK
jgi:outer membrane protein assembly factor BamB